MSTPPVGVRARIVAATLEVIGRHGVAGVTNRRVAEAAGVSLGTLTYHFDAQADLLRETLVAFVDGEARRLAALATAMSSAREDGAPPIALAQAAEAVEHIVEERAERLQQIGQFELYLQAARDPQLRAAAARCFAAFEGVAVAALDALGVEGSADHASALVALVDGLVLRRLATGEPDARAVADALATYVNGVASAPRSPVAGDPSRAR